MPEEQQDAEVAAFFQNVSRETKAKLDIYSKMLVEWNDRFNLVAASTIPHLWRRHFLDSAQLCAHLPWDPKVLADLGSGAGFPGLVLAIMTNHEVHLVESTGKKVSFLQAVATELKLNVTIHQERIEALRDLKADIISARALKALPQLLAYAKPLMRKDSSCIFLKGQALDAELTEAAKSWTFDAEKKPSLSDPSGKILILRNLVWREQRGGRKR